MDFGADLLLLLVSHQRRLEELAQPTEFPISLSLGHLLSEIAEAPTRGPSELATILGADPSIVSRWIKEANKRGFLVSTRPTHDGRRKHLSLTKAGRTISTEENKIVSGMIASLVTPLSADEVQSLEHYFNQLADGLGSPVAAADIALSDLARALRRLSRISGLLEGTLLATNIEFHDFQLMLALSSVPEGVSQAHLAKLVRRHPSRISRHVIKLENSSLILREKNDQDARSAKLCLSSEGKKLVSQVLTQLQNQLEKACFTWLDKDKQHFLALLRKYCQPANISSVQLTVERIFSEEQQAQARAFIATHLVTAGRANEIPARFFDGTHAEFLVRKMGEIIGAVEFEKHFYLFFSDEERPLIEQKITNACEILLKENKSQSLCAISLN